RRGDDLDRVRHHLVADGARIRDAGRGGAIDTHAKEARGDKQLAQLRVGQRAFWIVLGRVRQLITGELFGNETVKWLVGVEGADDVVTILVGVAARRIG